MAKKPAKPSPSNLVGLAPIANGPVLDAFYRKDLLPEKFDRAFAGVTEPGGNAVYNVDAVLAILGNGDRAKLLSQLDDLEAERRYKAKGRPIVLVSFGCAVVSPFAPPNPPTLTNPPKK
jgi:hypothetical protein